jgi:hypothetical protein
MMSTQVYITKNVDAAVEIQDILTKQYGINIYDHTFFKIFQIPYELHHARQIATSCEEHAPDSDCKGLALDRELAASEELIRDIEFTVGSHGSHFMF